MSFDDLIAALPNTVKIEFPVTYEREKDGVTAHATLSPGVVSSLRFQFSPLPTTHPEALFRCLRIGIEQDLVRAYHAWLQQEIENRVESETASKS